MSAPVRHIRYPFGTSNTSRAVREEADYDAYIVQLIKQVLLTAKGERVCRPEFGAGLRRQVFAPLNDATAALTRTLVYEALNHWLGTLIKLENIDVITDGDAMRVIVEYIVIARGTRRILNEEVPF